MPESGIDDCSARQDKNFPLSSILGVKLNIDVVMLPSDDFWKINFILCTIGRTLSTLRINVKLQKQ